MGWTGLVNVHIVATVSTHLGGGCHCHLGTRWNIARVIAEDYVLYRYWNVWLGSALNKN